MGGGLKKLEALEKIDQKLKENVKKVDEEAAWEQAMEDLENLAEKLKVKTGGDLQDDAGSLQKKEESGLQFDEEAAEFVEDDGGLEMEEETGGGLEEEEKETDGGLVMEKLEELEDELDVLKEGLQKG
ncbi:parathymosin-like [Branchiostoma lanceolatum]|uniref:parathymosin-like n=1 Tax=Branchiostoma lanceolatum TaxID=7740 RepID=UPI0034569396